MVVYRNFPRTRMSFLCLHQTSMHLSVQIAKEMRYIGTVNLPDFFLTNRSKSRFAAQLNWISRTLDGRMKSKNGKSIRG